jgi:hypothetical protein
VYKQTGSDGSEYTYPAVYAGWFDTQTNAPCVVMTASDSTSRCMPLSGVGTPSNYVEMTTTTTYSPQ